jgi:hypothetical protein
MTDETLDEKVVALGATLREHDVPFAFGGALALAYYAVPRATIDVDLNVFVEPAAIDRIRKAFASLGVAVSSANKRAALKNGQVRLRWGPSPVDVFFAYDKFHFNAAQRIRVVRFGADKIPILAAEDLMTCKVVFDRRKDWLDIEQMLLLNAGAIDIDDARRWIVAIVGADDARLARFEQAVREVLGQ